MIDRTQPPDIQAITEINYEVPQVETYANGIKSYTLFSDSVDVVRISAVFCAGKDFQDKSFLATLANSLLKEGPEGRQPDETADLLEYYGCYVENEVGNKTATFSLYAPLKNIDRVLPVFVDSLRRPLLPDKELAILQNAVNERVKVSLKKTRFVAMQQLNALLFGPHHPRGVAQAVDDVFKVTKSDIRQFVDQHYTGTGCFVTLTGHVTAKVREMCRSQFALLPSPVAASSLPTTYLHEDDRRKVFVPVADSAQSSVVMGSNLGMLTEVDALNLEIVNTILGDYFGSRLMRNIREDKGYTYGIASKLVRYSEGYTLYIVSDVANAAAQNVVNEIFKELHTLSHEQISLPELQLVKNYLLGNTMSALNGVFNTCGVWEYCLSVGRDFDFLQRRLSRIRDITPQEVLLTARKFLDVKRMLCVVAGTCE